MQSIISATELSQLIGSQNIVIIDATSGASSQQQYETEHIKGALYVNLERDLSNIGDPKDGGRHPLPSPKQFSTLLSNLGISLHSHVVVYDRANGANAASRCWWMLRAAGIETTQVLDGGFVKAQDAGIPLGHNIEKASVKTDYSFPEWRLPRLDMYQVSDLTKKPQESLIIDVREESRYNGETEPIDLIAGHIPTATNIPFKHNLNADHTFKSPEELYAFYLLFFENKNPDKVVVHCGSGVTACHTLLALDHAGFNISNLYVGSWSEWSRNKT